jgi:signal transduction histidine kinase
MELAKEEVALVERAALEAQEAQLRELHDLQLAAIGGGIGNTIL